MFVFSCFIDARILRNKSLVILLVIRAPDFAGHAPGAGYARRELVAAWERFWFGKLNRPAHYGGLFFSGAADMAVVHAWAMSGQGNFCLQPAPVSLSPRLSSLAAVNANAYSST